MLADLRRAVAEGGLNASTGTDADLSAEPAAGYRARFVEAISEDLGLPAALAAVVGWPSPCAPAASAAV